MLPFGAEQFLEVFGHYNESVWPFQIVLKGLAAAVSILLLRPQAWSDRFIAAVLAALWAWAGLAYHLWHLRSINPAGSLFAAAFVLAALVFAWQGVVRGRMRFEVAGGIRFAVGATLIVYALLIYPQISLLVGHYYPTAPTFGAPCPVTLFTLGVLVFMASPYPKSVLVIPVAWAVIGLVAVIALGMLEDLGLLAAAAAGMALLLRQQTWSWWRRGL